MCVLLSCLQVTFTINCSSEYTENKIVGGRCKIVTCPNWGQYSCVMYISESFRENIVSCITIVASLLSRWVKILPVSDRGTCIHWMSPRMEKNQILKPTFYSCAMHVLYNMPLYYTCRCVFTMRFMLSKYSSPIM